MNESIDLYEILVPGSHRKTRYKFEHHEAWDNFVKEITGGLTVLKGAKGTWRSPNGEYIRDRIIPVRIACTREQLERIIDFTIDHYKQEAVMAYKISEEVIIKYANS